MSQFRVLPGGATPSIALIDNGQLISSVSFTSTDARNTFDADGLLVVDGAAINQPRRTYIDGRWYTWFDGIVENKLLHNRDLSQSPWVDSSGTASYSQDAVGLDGISNTAFTMTSDATNYRGRRQDITVLNDSNTHRFIVPVSKAVSGFPGVGCTIGGGTTVGAQWTLNTTTGTLTPRNSNAGTVSASMVETDSYWLVLISAANNSTGNVTLSYAQYPAVASSDSGVWVSTATGSAVFDMPCVFLNSNVSLHPFETGAAAISLGAEIASMTLGGWFNSVQNSIVASVWLPTLAGTQTIFELWEDATNYIRLQVNATGNVVATVADAGGTGGTITSTGTLTAGTLQKVALVQGSGGFRIHINGAKDGENATLTIPTGLATANIGNANGSNYLYAGISDLLSIPSAISETEANARTTL